jgi:hypothetical protein
MNNPKKNPTQVEQHIIHDKMSDMNEKIGAIPGVRESPINSILFLIPANILP